MGVRYREIPHPVSRSQVSQLVHRDSPTEANIELFRPLSRGTESSRNTSGDDIAAIGLSERYSSPSCERWLQELRTQFDSTLQVIRFRLRLDHLRRKHPQGELGLFNRAKNSEGESNVQLLIERGTFV